MEQTGTLMVRAYVSRAEIPVAGASVVVAQRVGTTGKYRLLFVRETDRNGESGMMTVPAPPRADSQHPGDPASYAVCDIWVEHPDYVPALMENVQIFPGVETVQKLQLIPLEEWATGTGQLDISEVTGQPL